MENKIKEALKIIFDFNYDGLLNEYLNTNLLATEIDFIDYIATNQNSHLEKLSPQIDFFFNEKINSDTEYENFIMRDEYWFYREYQNYLIEKRTKLVKALPPQPIVKQKPEPNGKLIIFKNSETIDKIHSELKGYFPNKEAELLKALQGEQLSELLLFPHNQNKFVEVFRRLKYNGFLLNTDTETKNWICTTFQFVKKGITEPQPFNESSVWDNLNKGKGEPTKKERICITEWLPYKSPLQLTRETENEKL